MKEPNSANRPHNIESLIRPHLLSGEEYVPIEPVEVLAKRVGKRVEDIIKLDANENPYGCSPKVRDALKNHPYYHIYPDPEQREFRKAVSRYVGVADDHIVGGSGSDDLIELIIRLFIGPGDKIINCVPTFGMYSFLTGLYNGKVTDVSRNQSFDIEMGQVRAAIDGQTKIVFIASPNNPTGNLTPIKDVKDLLRANVIVVVDEAYAEFSGASMAHMVPDYDNLIVLRTFSKWAGLAGVRVGYGVFPKKIVPFIMKTKQPYNINSAAEVAALASLNDLAYLQNTVAKLVLERERMFSKLAGLSFLQPYPSKANFILCRVTKGKARVIQDRLKQKGIFVRYFDTPLLRSYLRLTVGKPQHTDSLISELETIGESL